MALPATDDFNRADSSDLGTNWDVIFGDGHQVSSNECLCNTDFSSGYDAAEIWNADSFDDDQYSEATVTGVVGVGATGVAVRGSTDNFYGYYSDDFNCYLFKVVGGSFTTFATGTSWSNGEVCRLEAEGTTITPLIDGSEDTSVGAQTDSDISSGAAGVSGYDVTAHSIDDWEGGNLGGAPPGRTTYNTDASPLGIRTAISWRLNSLCIFCIGYAKRIAGYSGQLWNWQPMRKKLVTI